MFTSTTASLILALQDGLVFADSSGDGDPRALAYLLFLSGFVFYGYVFLRYRNADKRHRHEKETQAELHNVAVRDDYRRTMKGLSNASMRGSNHRSVEGSLNKPLGGVPGAVSKFLK